MTVFDVLDTVARPVIDAEVAVCQMEGAKKTQRIHMAIERTIAAADHVGSNVRLHLLDFTAVEERDFIFCDTLLAVNLLEHCRPRLHFPFGQAEVQPARALETNIEPGPFFKFGLQLRPSVRGTDRPVGVGRHAEALALHPDEREVAARSPLGNIALVENDDALSFAR